ncbi:MAG: hypothetical protein HQK65_17525 [Desulfamplus sp.]|nr:hypothetical protein [Desulfamplus sp.]
MLNQLNRKLFTLFFFMHRAALFLQQRPSTILAGLNSLSIFDCQKKRLDMDLEKARRLIYHFPDEAIDLLKELQTNAESLELPQGWVKGFMARLRKEYLIAKERKAICSGTIDFDFTCVFEKNIHRS